MKFEFEDFSLDLALGQLSRADEDVQVEPRVFALLSYLVENSSRLVTKDELVQQIWEGRIVSDAALSTLIKSARRVLDDDGQNQRLIRTVHGRGFRFVGALSQSISAEARKQEAAPLVAEPAEPAREGGRPSIAVLPFRRVGQTDTWGAMADAVPAELISSLSRLRWLRVLARGSTFRFRDQIPDLDQVRTTLGAAYCLTGDVEIFGPNLTIAVELSDTRNGQIVWGERSSGKIEDVHQIRGDIIRLVTSEMELHVSLNEAEHARLRPPESLDAWDLYHIGLRHMYRFNAKDNEIAADYFSKATRLDPNFARAFAARSFTSFQFAFVNYKSNRAAEIENARRFAEKCLEIDPMDPFGNFNLGRSYWLRGEHEAGQGFVARSVGLSPSFAHGMYANAFSDLIAGRGDQAIAKLDEAIILSPLDPFLYAMQSAKGFSLLHNGDLEQACDWLETGSRQPGAHYLVTFITAAASFVAGNTDQAHYWAERTLQLRPSASIRQFFEAYPLQDQQVRDEIHKALQQLGFPEN
jgi:DNA-binding winged helix-turn-helix (wHTH) protein/tetratricopeptide (TPR) repeat protein